jgi:hypothetical protein
VSAFEELVFTRTVRALASIPAPDEVYAVSMFVYETNNDPRFLTATIQYNTVAQCAAISAGQPNARGSYATDSGEAKWNSVFWLQDQLAQIPDDESGTDADGAGARRAWLDENRFWVDDAVFDSMSYDEAIVAINRITEAFCNLCVSVSRRLHADGTITSVFGRAIPVIIHGLDYCDWDAALTREANPPGVADEFVAWIDAM